MLALLVLHRAKLLASNQSVLALGVAPSGVRAAAPHSAPSRGEGVFGKDAEIRTHQALHEAKPIECPKGDRDNKSELYFKNILFLQTVTAVSHNGGYLYIKNSGTGKPIPLSEGKDLRHIKVTLRKTTVRSCCF